MCVTVTPGPAVPAVRHKKTHLKREAGEILECGDLSPRRVGVLLEERQNGYALASAKVSLCHY